MIRRCIFLLAASHLCSAAIAQPATVLIRNFVFSPADLSIHAGTTVRWDNQDSMEHSATSQTGPGTLILGGLFDSGLFGPGESYQFTFTEPGVYHYFCTAHGSSMQGVVRVSLPVCEGDFNHSGAVSVQDIFDFLAAYFAGQSAADFNHSDANTVQDIFDFLAAYFMGCE